jgi:undecaprenyl-diphosphatase
MAFFFMSGFLFLLFDRDSRRLLLSRGPYVASLVSAVLFSPVIFWNARNGWVTVKHTAGQAHIQDGLTFSAGHFFEFLGSQLGVVTPVLFVAMTIALWRLRKDRRGIFLLSFSAPVLLFFLLKSIQGKVQANWALPAYAAGFIGFAAYYATAERLAKKAGRWLVASSVALALFVTICAYFPSILNLPRKLDPSARLRGWQELGVEADRVFGEMSGKAPVFIFSDSYQVSSELAFYMDSNPVTYCVNLGRRMNQYDLWPGFESLKRYDAIFVMGGEQQMPGPLAAAFVRYEKVPLSLDIGQGRIVKFTLFKCYDFKGIKSRPAESY